MTEFGVLMIYYEWCRYLLHWRRFVEENLEKKRWVGCFVVGGGVKEADGVVEAVDVNLSFVVD